jgi:hypothetical protein
MSTIARTLESLETGPASSFRNLTVFPLLHRSDEEASYLTLDEALEAGCARVTEIDQSGSVPELRFVNEGERPVLLLDGEELVGAKQNRVLNLTILVPPRTEIVVPVSCVEAGRWAYDSPSFAAAKHLMYQSGRASKLRQVSRAMAETGRASSDQRAVWNDIGEMLCDLETDSPSNAMRDAYRRHETTIEDYVRAIPHESDQAGGVFAINGVVLGLEVLDNVETMRKMLPKLVRSYALDAIGSQAARPQPIQERSVSDFLEDVAAAHTRSSRAIGMGRDVRLSGRRIAGGALVDRDHVVHLSAFRLDEGAHSDDAERGLARMLQFSRRALKFRDAS